MLSALLAAAQVLTLEQALQNARANQPQIVQAHAATQGAEARADQARSGLLPQLNANAGISRTIAHPAAEGSGAALVTGNSFTDSLTANQLIWDFGETANRWRSSRAAAQAQGESEQQVRRDVELNLRAAFFNARAQKSLVAVAQETLDNQQRHLEQTKGFVEVGTHPEIDLAQARADVANARVQFITQQNAYLVAKAQLNQAMGVEGPTDYDVADQGLAPVGGEDAQVDQLLKEAIDARPDVRALQDQLRAQQLAVSAERGAYGPAISANAGLAQAGSSIDDMGWRATVGVGLSWGIFQGGLTNALVREAEASVAQTDAQLASLRLQVRLDVEQALLGVRAAKSTIDATREALTSARERLRLAEGRYQAGAGSELELSDAQLQLTNAAAQVVQADQRLATARAQLLRALGREEAR